MKRTRILIPAITGLCLAAVAVSFVFRPGTTPDPAVPDGSSTGSQPAESSNMASFVGHQQCADCHFEIHESHVQTPHARTLTTTASSSAAQSLCDAVIAAGADYGTYHYQCDQEGLMAELPDTFPGRMFPLEYAFGSGEHAVTFLTLLDDHGETVGIEHRMSWFQTKDGVSQTPGHARLSPTRDVELFGKIIRGDDLKRCVSCHVTTGKVVGTNIHDFTPAIHCERCHGPGAEHVAAASDGSLADLSTTIRSGWSADAEIKLCGECHRTPADISSERLKRYPNSVVRFQPVGLLQSRCYLESNNTLSCTSCHNPHEGVHSRSLELQNQTCRDCHQDPASQTLCGSGQTNNCIDCHMPAIELVDGISFRDHWIRVRSDDESVRQSTAEDSPHGTSSEAAR